MQGAEDRVRVAIRLTSVASEREVWTTRYEYTTEDLINSQDDIAASIDAEIQTHLFPAELERLRDVPDEELDSWGLLARYVTTPFSRTEKYLELWEKVVIREDGYAFAHSQFGEISLKDPDRREQSLHHTNRALDLTPANMWVLRLASSVHARIGDMRYALELAEKADEIGGAVSTFTIRALILNNRFSEALGLGESHTELMKDLFGWNLPYNLAVACIALGKVEEAVAWGRKSVVAGPARRWNWMILACAHALSGNRDEAREALEKAQHAGQYQLSLTDFELGFRRYWRNQSGIVEPTLAAIPLLAALGGD